MLIAPNLRYRGGGHPSGGIEVSLPEASGHGVISERDLRKAPFWAQWLDAFMGELSEISPRGLTFTRFRGVWMTEKKSGLFHDDLDLSASQTIGDDFALTLATSRDHLCRQFWAHFERHRRLWSVPVEISSLVWAARITTYTHTTACFVYQCTTSLLMHNSEKNKNKPQPLLLKIATVKSISKQQQSPTTERSAYERRERDRNRASKK